MKDGFIMGPVLVVNGLMFERAGKGLLEPL